MERVVLKKAWLTWNYKIRSVVTIGQSQVNISQLQLIVQLPKAGQCLEISRVVIGKDWHVIWTSEWGKGIAVRMFFL